MLYRHRALVFLFFLSVITYLDRVCIAVAGPRMQAELGIGPERWGWVVGAFTLGYALFEIPSGMLADRIGARNVLTRIVIWWSAFTALTGTVRGFTSLVLIRFAFGAGEAGAYPGAASAVSRWFPAPERSRAQGVIWMASRVGGMLSPLLVVPIQQVWGWRASFFVFAALGVVWAIAWHRWYRDRPRDKPGIGATELAVIEQSAAGANAAEHMPLPWRQVIRRGVFWRLIGMYHAYCWGAFFYLSWLHTYLQKGRGMTEDQMRLWSALPFVVGACCTLAGGVLSERLARSRGLRFGRRVVGGTGLLLGAVFLLLAAAAPTPTLSALCLTAGYGAMDFFLPVSWAVALDVGGRHAGGISGAMNMAGQIGSFVSSVAFGYLVKLGSYNVALVPLAAMTALGAILFFGVDPTRPLIPAAVSAGARPAT